MLTDMIKSFIEEIMGMCLDNNIESNEIPNIIMQMVLKVGDNGDIEKIFDEITQECSIDLYENAVNQLEIYEAMECIYQLPNSLNKESAIKLISKRPGFVYSPEIETIIQ